MGPLVKCTALGISAFRENPVQFAVRSGDQEVPTWHPSSCGTCTRISEGVGATTIGSGLATLGNLPAKHTRKK